jgi:GAF domain-containing protein
MTDQISRATESERAQPGVPTRGESFRDRLLAELAALAVVQRTAARAGRLHRVSTGLSEARTPEQVAGVVLEEGTAALGAARGAFLRLDDGKLSLIGALGMSDLALDRAKQITMDDTLPSTDAIRQRHAVWVESQLERERRYPELAMADPDSRALVSAPLLVGARTLGVLRFGFDTDLVVDDDERDFVDSIAAQAASALDRSLAYAAEHEARQLAEQTAGRLARLQEITAALSSTLDESEVASVVLGHAVAALGSRIGTLCLLTRPATPLGLDPDAEIRIAHMAGITVEAQRRWSSFRLSEPLPVPEAIRTNSTLLIPTLAERHRRYPLLAGGLPEDEHALVVAPLSVGARRLGALTLSFFPEARDPATEGVPAGSPPELGATDLAFLTSLADVCAQALDRAAAVRALRAASARLAFLAEASVELSSSLDYSHTLRRVADLAVPVLADWCSVATAESEGLQSLAVAHVDPERVSIAWELERRYPARRETSASYRVLATRQSEMYPEVTDEQIFASAVDDEHRALLRAIGPMRSVMLVPMVARERALGVLTLVSASEERRFGPEDLALAEDLARRAALAIDNAALFRDATAR